MRLYVCVCVSACVISVCAISVCVSFLLCISVCVPVVSRRSGRRRRREGGVRHRKQEPHTKMWGKMCS